MDYSNKAHDSLQIYEPLAGERRSFRLLRLFADDDGPLQCELFHADFDQVDTLVPYEALSYTWGGLEKSSHITANGLNIPVTQNLKSALSQLQKPYEDRILWVDALCINQDDNRERTHQVQQMSAIYRHADKVLVWLGESTSDDDYYLMESLQPFQKQCLQYACTGWKPEDERWAIAWIQSQGSLMREQPNHQIRLQRAFEDILGRPWFKRVWILQEIASARRADICLGGGTISARLFCLVPTLIGLTVGNHLRSVLDVMPGPYRANSWWSRPCELLTLMHKFQSARASVPRDLVYALVGLCSNERTDSPLVVDYSVPDDELTKNLYAHTFRVRMNVSDRDRLNWQECRTMSDLFHKLKIPGSKELSHLLEQEDISQVLSYLCQSKPVLVTSEHISLAVGKIALICGESSSGRTQPSDVWTLGTDLEPGLVAEVNDALEILERLVGLSQTSLMTIDNDFCVVAG